MAVDEEYLDNLLKTMTDNEEKEATEKSSPKAEADSEGGAAYDLQSLLGDVDAIDKGSSGMLEEALSIDDDWKFSLDDILAQADGENTEGEHVVDLSNWEKEEPSAVEESIQQDIAGTGADVTGKDGETDIDIGADTDIGIDIGMDADAGIDADIDTDIDIDIDTGSVDVPESFVDEPVTGEDWDIAELPESDNVDIPVGVDTGVNLSDFAYEDMAGSEEPEPVSLDNINKNDDVETHAEEERAGLADSAESLVDTDSELAEIDGLLKNTEKRDTADDDMLALLEGVDTIQMNNSYDEEDTVFDIFADGALGEENVDQGEGETDGGGSKGGKKKKKKGKLFGKKSKKEATASEEKENAAPDELDLDHLFNEALGSGEDGQEKKKAGFFTRAMEYLTQEEDDWEEELKENVESSDETEEKASAKDKKKKKSDKKKKKGKNKEAEEGAEENGEEEGEGAPKSKKKPKKEKKEKPPKEKTKSVKVLSTKKLLVLIAFCATIVASVLVLANFLPEYADKQEARDAFYEGDYEKVYQLLYDKQLNDSDRIVFGRARVLLKLERKLQSYENNIALGREVEAVDALMRGMKCYEELIVSDVYGAREELDAIYGQICGLLSQYGVTPEEAAQINAYDEITYTKQLHALVEGAGFTAPGGEEPAKEPSAPQDLLPEEEDVLP